MSNLKRITGLLAIMVILCLGMAVLVRAETGESPIPDVNPVGSKVEDGFDISTKPLREIDQPGVYIIRLNDLPLASYRGGIPGLEATNPYARSERKLDANSPESTAYRDYLLEKQAEFIARMDNRLNRAVEVKDQYYAATNGMAVVLSPEEARQIKEFPEVAYIQPEFMRYLTTDVSPDWLGAPGLWDGTNTGGIPGSMGEGIIIGVIDTGINPSNPSFADIGGDSYNHTNPWGSGVYVGVCNSAESTYDPTFPCNDKLIGAWGYADINGGDPRDTHGHGSHTSSTAGGNFVSAHLVGNTTEAYRDISGIAPHANIVMYLACGEDGCPGAALTAAIDQVVIDGVDVVNYSIGGGATDPWEDTETMSFLSARDAGIFVATSAGNNGPNPATVGAPANAPWIFSIAATSHTRKTTNALINMSGGGTAPPADIFGVSFTGGYGPAAIVYAGNYGDALCLNPFTPGTFNGQIVVCDRGINARVEKGQNVLNGGAGGLILANSAAEGSAIVSDDHYLPAVHITYEDGVILKNWVNDGGGVHNGTIRGTIWEENDDWADILTDFSSRGPNRSAADIIKPDIAAPGEDVLAALGVGDPSPAEWGLMGGTSMASPHAAGGGALLMSLHPGWTPAEIQSAMMMTAWQDVVDYDGVSAVDAFDTGSGRIDLSKASKVGFVLNETRANYENADPKLGGDPSSLNLASLGNGACWQSCTWTRTLRSTLSTSMNWTVSASAAGNMDLTVTPSSFTLPAGGTQVITVQADVTMVDPNTWTFGEIRLTPTDSSVPQAHLPVAAYANSSTNLRVLDKSANVNMTQVGNTIQYTIDLTHKSLSAKTYNLVDSIPAHSSYVNGSASGGLTYNAGPDNLTWSDTLPAGSFVISEENKSGYISMGDLGIPGADLPSGGGDNSCWLVGLDMYYFDTYYSTGVWGTNGVLEVGEGPLPLCPSATNGSLPSADFFNNYLAPFWADLNLNAGGSWYYVAVTWDGKVHTVFEWENVPIKGTSNTATFQIWIEDGTDNIWFSYPPGGLPAGSPTATIGAENSNGTIGAQYYYNGTGTIPNGGVDLVVGPEAVYKQFGFQVTVDDLPDVTNEVEVTQGGVTDVSYAFTDVYHTNTWLGNTTNWGTGSNWSRGASPVDTDWVIIPSSPSGGNMPVMTANGAVRNLEIQAGAMLDMGTYKLTVQDTLINHGMMKQTISSVPAGSKTAFLNITNASGAQQKHMGIELTPTSGAMGSTTVQISGNSECTVADPTDTVNRCFEIIPTTPQTSTVRFYYRTEELDGQDSEAIKAWRWSGSGWSQAGTVGLRDDTAPDYLLVETSGVTGSGKFALSDKTGGPTAVDVDGLGTGQSNGILMIGIAALVVLVGAGSLLLLRRRKVS